MTEKCIRCGGPAAYPIRALEICTLHVRNLGGERRVQALGDEKEGAVLAAGIVIEAVTLLFLKGHQIGILLGIAALICGALGLYEALRGAKEKDRALRGLPEAEALGEAAWDVWLAEMPKKEEQNDLTYLPINEKTLARKNGDLMILYHLLPEIAVEAWTRIHGRSNIINLNCPEPATQDSGTGGIE